MGIGRGKGTANMYFFLRSMEYGASFLRSFSFFSLPALAWESGSMERTTHPIRRMDRMRVGVFIFSENEKVYDLQFSSWSEITQQRSSDRLVKERMNSSVSRGQLFIQVWVFHSSSSDITRQLLQLHHPHERRWWSPQTTTTKEKWYPKEGCNLERINLSLSLSVYGGYPSPVRNSRFFRIWKKRESSKLRYWGGGERKRESELDNRCIRNKCRTTLVTSETGEKESESLKLGNTDGQDVTITFFYLYTPVRLLLDEMMRVRGTTSHTHNTQQQTHIWDSPFTSWVHSLSLSLSLSHFLFLGIFPSTLLHHH